jgi:hypothetical protein
MPMARWVGGIAGWSLLVGGIAACAGSGARAGNMASADTPVAERTAAPIAKVHKAKCGSCHLRVEPGERSREELETAFTRHRRRVHLSEAEWGEMVEYLAVK